jgi:uncharacterized protein (TIGR02117 family)
MRPGITNRRASCLPLALLAAFCGCSQGTTLRPPGTRTAYILDRGFHTDVGLPTAQLDPPLQPLATFFPGARTLLIGFGDRTFVQSRGHRELTDWLLALLPGDGAMLVTGLNVPPEKAFPPQSVVALRLTPDEWTRLESFVRASFAPRSGVPARLAEGPYAGSRFFASSLTYDLLATCNTWTAEALRAAGQPMPVNTTLFAGQVLRAARHMPAAISAARPPSAAAAAADCCSRN